MSAMPAISVTISKDGMIAIPKKLRQALKWADGQSVVLRQTAEGILIEKPSDPPLRAKAKALVRQAKWEAANQTRPLTSEEIWAQYDAAAIALRKALRAKRTKKHKL